MNSDDAKKKLIDRWVVNFEDGKTITVYDSRKLAESFAMSLDFPCQVVHLREVPSEDVEANDDPAVWLVEEFGGVKHLNTSGGFFVNRYPLTLWGVSDARWWHINGMLTPQPLTRDDVRRLCEIFGVEVRK